MEIWKSISSIQEKLFLLMTEIQAIKASLKSIQTTVHQNQHTLTQIYEVCREPMDVEDSLSYR